MVLAIASNIFHVTIEITSTAHISLARKQASPSGQALSARKETQNSIPEILQQQSVSTAFDAPVWPPVTSVPAKQRKGPVVKQPSESLSFASSPLITPERLSRGPEEALRPTPPWAVRIALADPEAPLDFSICVMRLGETRPDQYNIHVLSVAILFELTRFGNSVATNSNRRGGDAHAKDYVKITYSGAPHDDTPIARIIMGAKPREAVISAPNPRNLDPAELGMRGAGKPTKDARAIAMSHAERCAREQALPEAEVSAYLENLVALFAFHDELLGISPV
jgi:hypothetical protein